MDAECKTLWMGDIQAHWDEAFISSLFAATGEQPVVKLIRDKVTGYPAGYGFLEFPTQRGAQLVLETYNGQVIPNTLHRFRMNWGAGGRRIETSDDHSIFVGDLAPDVGDELLLSTFSTRFSSVRGAKVVIDPVTRMSKGFGFVRFGSKEEADQALQTMNGVYCSSRPMRVSVATDRNGKPRSGNQGYGSGAGGMGNTEEEGANTTVFVGGLDPSTTEEELRARFGAIGDIVSVKVPPGRGCGFVQYTTKEAAEVAISQMNGTVIGSVKVRCAWGRSAAVRAAAAAGGAGGYYQQYPNYQQSGYQNYYGYGGYYPQYQQVSGYGGYGYGSYDQQGSQQHGGYHQHGHGHQSHHGGHHGHHRHQDPRDFTRPDDIDAMNRRYASQRAYQHMPPAANASYSSMSSDVTKGTAMAGSM
ncbi:Nuclear acid binding, partial [Globisporangium splendens]